jgi:hypothetical protein
MRGRSNSRSAIRASTYVQVRDQGINVCFILDGALPGFMGIEITVGTFFYTPGQVYIK